MADNALIDLIRKGYYEDLAKSKRNVGFSGVEGDMLNMQAENRNALSPMITNQSLGQSPQNFISSSRTGQSYDLGNSGRNIMLRGMPAVVSPNGNDITVYHPSGNQVQTSVAEQNALAEQERRNAELADLPRRKALAEIAAKEAETKKITNENRVGIKPTFEAKLGGYVYAPSAENPTGKFVKLEGVEAGDGSATEGERKAGSLLMRLEGSRRQLDAALKANPKAEKPELGASMLRTVGLESAANASTNSERQRIDSAQEDLLDAALTLGTGAAYTKEQLTGYKKAYFPQIGDSAEQIADKQVRLKNIIDAAHMAAGSQSKKVKAHFDKLDATVNSGSGIPKTGELVDGHIFLGGNPADPSRWRKQ